jgi:hypothetical protein
MVDRGRWRNTTDNTNVKAKSDFRAEFLDRYHPEGPVRIFEACQGTGLIWGKLREIYGDRLLLWGVDVKPAKGRLAIKSERILSLHGWEFDVIDVDTWGPPWKHWIALLGNLYDPCTVFLTLGAAGPAGGGSNADHLAALGLKTPFKIPEGLAAKVYARCTPYFLGMAERFGHRVIECVELEAAARCRYFGIRLEPMDPDMERPPVLKQAIVWSRTAYGFEDTASRFTIKHWRGRWTAFDLETGETYPTDAPELAKEWCEGRAG